MAITPEEIDDLVSYIVGGSQESYVTELTNSLIEGLMDGVLDAPDRRVLETLARANRQKLQTVLMAHKARIDDEVMTGVQTALMEADSRDVAALEAYYGAEAATGAVAAARAAGMSAHFEEIAYQTARGLSEIIARQNIALESLAERTWYEVAGDSITAINQGLKPRDKVIADAVSRLADAGITTIDYASGISNQVDVAIKRHLVSQVSQVGGEITLARLNAYGHDLVITSAHYGARPSHALWQGKPCCTSGPTVKDGVRYPGLNELTGYGTVQGLKGVNCRHSIGPYFPDITEIPDTEFPEESEHFGMSSADYYAATQRQRELERRIRATKREIAGMEKAGLGLESPSLTQKRLVLGKQQRTLAVHVQQNKLVRQPKREKAYGIGEQPRSLRVNPSRAKGRTSPQRYPVKQADIDSLLANELQGVRFSASPTYNYRIKDYGLTDMVEQQITHTRSIKAIEIGRQKKPGNLELIDTLLHEELEARIFLRAGYSSFYEALDVATDKDRHAYIQKIINRYVKMRGWN